MKTDLIEAEKYQLRGSDGKLAATFSVQPDGQVTMSFLDQSGNIRLAVGLDEKRAPHISFFGPERVRRMRLTLDQNNGAPSVLLFDDGGKPGISLDIDPSFGPRLTIGKTDQGRIEAGVFVDGSPRIQLWDQKNRSRMSLNLLNDVPMITLTDDKRMIRSSWMLSRDGSPSFSLYDEKQRPRLVVMTDKDGKPLIRFVNPDGQAIRELRADVELK